MNFLIYIAVFWLTVRTLSFTAAAISYFRQKKYLNNYYQPDQKDLRAKASNQYVY
jgi:hypothetical protein